MSTCAHLLNTVRRIDRVHGTLAKPYSRKLESRVLAVEVSSRPESRRTSRPRPLAHLQYAATSMVSIDIKDTLKALILALLCFSGVFELMATGSDEATRLTIRMVCHGIVFYFLLKGLFWGMRWRAVPSFVLGYLRSPIRLVVESIALSLWAYVGYLMVASESEVGRIVAYSAVLGTIGFGVIWFVRVFRTLAAINSSRYDLQSEAGRQLYMSHVGVLRHIQRISYSPRHSGNVHLVWLYELPALIVGFWIHPQILLLWFLAFILRMYHLQRVSSPPLAIVLGESTPAAHETIVVIQRIVKPSMVTSLLVDDRGQAGLVIHNIHQHLSAWDSLRIRDSTLWQEAVRELLAMAYFIVVERSIDTDAVRFELDVIREQQLEEKCHFVVDVENDGGALRKRLGREFKLRDMYSVVPLDALEEHFKGAFRGLRTGRA